MQYLQVLRKCKYFCNVYSHYWPVLLLEVCGSNISATRPVPVHDDAYPYRTRPVPKIATRPDPTRPAGIPVPVAYP